MANEELIADTNLLLQRLLEIDAAQRSEGERAKKEMEEQMDQIKIKRDEAMKTRLVERGVPEESVGEEDWDARLKESQKRTEENMKLMRDKDAIYKEELIKELRTQTELLEQIAAKLD